MNLEWSLPLRLCLAYFSLVCRFYFSLSFQPWLWQLLRRWLIKAYPYLHALYEGIQFLYQVRYLFQRTQYFSPWLHVTGQKVRRLALHDMV